MICNLRLLFLVVIFILLQEIAARDRHLPLSPRASLPAPIVIPASQDFDGNDGPWSSFVIRVGTPAQDVKVLISTAGYQTWAVLPQGCTSSDPPTCGVSRGGEFRPNESSTWVTNNLTSKGIFSLGLELNLGYSGNNGQYGYDTVALGWEGSGAPTLDQQIVVGIDTKQFYLGIFGLCPRPTNFTNFNNPTPSYLSNLRKKLLIPSISWGYTAGNQYRLNKVLGSLTLGGYDSSRFIPNNVSFAFNEIDIRDLTVVVKQVTMKTENISQVLLSTSIAAFVDSTLPYIYLPLDVCEKFEAAFGLTWNTEVQAYLVSDTLNNRLKAQNASVTFTLGTLTTGNTVDISLPYAAFDLIADYPLMPNKTRYFPLVRAANDSQYTLGRTFLQEAYLVADYERRNFSISQCDWNAGKAQNIVAIPAPSQQEAHTTESHHLSAGTIAGVAVGGSIALVFLLLAIYLLARKYSAVRTINIKKEENELDTNASRKYDEMDGTQLKQELEDTQHFGPELDGTQLKQELENTQHVGPELDGRVHIGHEVEGSVDWIAELPAPEHRANDQVESGEDDSGNEDFRTFSNT